MLTFPKRGSEIEVPVYERPERYDGEDDEQFGERQAVYEERRGITARVRLVSREVARQWGMKFAAMDAQEKARIAAAGGEAPLMGFTPEGLEEMQAFQRAVCSKALVSLDGFAVGTIDIGSISDNARLVELADECDLLGVVANAVTRAQTPTPKQGEF